MAIFFIFYNYFELQRTIQNFINILTNFPANYLF